MSAQNSVMNDASALSKGQHQVLVFTRAKNSHPTIDQISPTQISSLIDNEVVQIQAISICYSLRFT